jgi:hypothetical protein
MSVKIELECQKLFLFMHLGMFMLAILAKVARVQTLLITSISKYARCKNLFQILSKLQVSSNLPQRKQVETKVTRILPMIIYSSCRVFENCPNSAFNSKLHGILSLNLGRLTDPGSNCLSKGKEIRTKSSAALTTLFS